jgi:rRNA maturation protein Nop10
MAATTLNVKCPTCGNNTDIATTDFIYNGTAAIFARCSVCGSRMEYHGPNYDPNAKPTVVTVVNNVK